MSSADQHAAAIRNYLEKDRGLSASQTTGALFSNGVLDSLELVRLVAFVEESFGVSVPLSEASLENFDTVESIAALVARLAA